MQEVARRKALTSWRMLDHNMTRLHFKSIAILGKIVAARADVLDLVVRLERADIYPGLEAQNAACAAFKLRFQLSIFDSPNFEIPHASVSEA